MDLVAYAFRCQSIIWQLGFEERTIAPWQMNIRHLSQKFDSELTHCAHQSCPYCHPPIPSSTCLRARRNQRWSSRRRLKQVRALACHDVGHHGTRGHSRNENAISVNSPLGDRISNGGCKGERIRAPVVLERILTSVVPAVHVVGRRAVQYEEAALIGELLILRRAVELLKTVH